MSRTSKAGTAESADTLVSRGEVYRARAPGGSRAVVVEMVEYDPPRAIVRELVGCREHDTLRALNAGTCPICPAPAPAGDPFTVGLTVRGAPRAWRMPEWYQAVT